MKLSVLYLTNIPSPYKVSFFNELGKNNELTVVFDKYKSDEREDSWHDHNFENFTGIFLKGLSVTANSTFDLKIIKLLKRGKFDVVIVGNYSTPTGIMAINYLKIKKIPFILSVDGGLINYSESKIIKKIKKSLISSASLWLSTGKYTSYYLEYYGAQLENIQVYPFTTMKENDIMKKSLTLKEKQIIRNELDIPYSNMVLSVGRFISSKGFDLLIEASKSFEDDTGVYIVGGVPNTEYKNIIEKFDIENVHFINFLEYSELKKYYLAANVFVLPTRSDVWGLVINESIANGLPVVTTTSCVAGVEIIEEKENGYLVEKDNIKDLIISTNKILSNNELQYKMSENNLKKAQKYTIENMAHVTTEIVQKFKKTQ